MPIRPDSSNVGTSMAVSSLVGMPKSSSSDRVGRLKNTLSTIQPVKIEDRAEPMFAETQTVGYTDILVLGGINKDIYLYVPNLAGPGEVVNVKGVSHYAGGKGLNAAVAAAYMTSMDNVRVRMVGSVGADSDGDHLCVFMKHRGIEVNGIMCLNDEHTGNIFITVAPGATSVIVNTGANAKTSADDMNLLDLTSTRIPISIANFEAPQDAIRTLFTRTHTQGGLNILNIAPYQQLNRSLVDETDIIVVNEFEYRDIVRSYLADMYRMNELLHHPINSQEDYLRAAPTLVRVLGLGALIITRGERGADVVCHWGPTEVVSNPSDDVTVNAAHFGNGPPVIALSDDLSDSSSSFHEYEGHRKNPSLGSIGAKVARVAQKADIFNLNTGSNDGSTTANEGSGHSSKPHRPGFSPRQKFRPSKKNASSINGKEVRYTTGRGYDAVSTMRIPTEHVPEIVDGMGAGDCFVGSLAVLLGEGYDLYTAVELSNRMAAACIRLHGAAASYRPRAEVLPDLLVKIQPVDVDYLRRRSYARIIKKKKTKIRNKLISQLRKAVKSEKDGSPVDWDGHDGIYTVIEGPVLQLEDPSFTEKNTKTQILEEDDRIWIEEIVDELDGTSRVISRICVTDDGDVVQEENIKEDKFKNHLAEEKKNDAPLMHKFISAFGGQGAKIEKSK